LAAGTGALRPLIELGRRSGRPLVIGHRGAAAAAPENTLRSFRRAVELGVDLVEFDVIALLHGPLVVAHSDRLEEVTHGALTGRIGALGLEQLKQAAPELPTLDDALAFFSAEATSVGLHVDLKLTTRLDEVAASLARHRLVGRTVVSSFEAPSLRAIAREAPQLRIGFTYPEDRLGVSRRPWLHPAVRAGLGALRASVPYRLERMLTRAGASAVMLQHRLVTRAAVRRAEALGASVIAWTVDDQRDLERVLAAEVDGIVTNDPAWLLATLAA
jgi:glycerophosphoryl diester phosphodiesterase